MLLLEIRWYINIYESLQVFIKLVVDALTSRRPYKEPFPFEESFEMIIEGSGKHFDPEIVRLFVKNRKVMLSLYEKFNSYLSNNKK